MRRRDIVVVGIAAAVTSVTRGAAAQGADNPEAGVTAPEDLMKEHGVLNRCLLIYEEGLRRLRGGGAIWPGVFHHTASLVRTFVEQYHERNEERYIFPVFRKKGRLTDLVDTLEAQHKAGRTLTTRILELSSPGEFGRRENLQKLEASVESFIRMYRPHEAREDTVLFPALRTLVSARMVADLGDRMEEDERRVLGEGGFERSVAEVAEIEEHLGIYDLRQFTPRL
ncbi:MAG: hemerythrin domain-containing protein [Chthonomonadales bacterium]